MVASKTWQYLAVAGLSLAALAATPSLRSAGGRGALEPSDAGCEPQLVVQAYDNFSGALRVYDVDPATGAETPHQDWTARRVIDLSLAAFAPDGTLYAASKVEPTDRQLRWASVDLERQAVKAISPFPTGLNVIDLAFTPALDAEPLGYVLTGNPGPNGALELHAIESAWPLALQSLGPVEVPFPHNRTLGLSISGDGQSLYWLTQDTGFKRELPGTAWVPATFLRLLNLYPFARVAAPAAGLPGARVSIFSSNSLFHVDMIAETQTRVDLPFTTLATGAAYRPCPVGGVRVLPRRGLSTTEGGGGAEFTAVLTAGPTSDVTITFAASNPNEGFVEGRPLTFTVADWWVPQAVKVSGVPDGVADGDQPFTVTAASVESSDPAYDARQVDSVRFVNVDVDGPVDEVARQPQ